MPTNIYLRRCLWLCNVADDICRFNGGDGRLSESCSISRDDEIYPVTDGCCDLYVVFEVGTGEDQRNLEERSVYGEYLETLDDHLDGACGASRAEGLTA